MRSKGSRLVASAVAAEMERAERSLLWVSDRTGIECAVLVSKLRGREEFTMVDLANIAAALHVPVAALTPSAGPAAR